MRRKDAVEAMVEVFEKESGLLLKHRMNRVLFKLESLGMLPPPIQINENDIDESVHTITQDGEVCEWEGK